LYDLQLRFIATFESTGVMENITVMARESQFVLDVMLATLHKRDPPDQQSRRKISVPYLHLGIELLNLVR
jgi:hypothetical protein